MTSIATIQIFQGTHGIYYTYKGKNYDIHFPVEYALHTNLCTSCLVHGTYRGVFIGYCAKCIDEKMGKKFGNGFIGQGIERIDGDFSAWKTYLHHTKLDTIGCDKLVASTIENATATAATDATSTLDELDEINTNAGLVWIEDIQLWVKQERLSTLFSQMPELVEIPQQEQEVIQEIVPPAPISPSIISIKERMQNSAMLCGNN